MKQNSNLLLLYVLSLYCDKRNSDKNMDSSYCISDLELLIIEEEREKMIQIEIQKRIGYMLLHVALTVFHK